ncbi:aminotransferase class V-fold PLP-dependent enzyme [Pirellulales bacterium]|nr:aminotransferase class V-fold PLP-dependent enzyme [Pirellulales bacterium]
MNKKDDHPQRRYLDNAATTWPKPEAVWKVWEQAARENGVTIGRGVYREAIAAENIVRQLRQDVATLMCVSPERICLPFSATFGLNQAIHGVLKCGDHVIATAADHNATLRPLRHLEKKGQIHLTIVPCDIRGWVDPDEVVRAWQANTRLVALSHASNVTGVVQDVKTIVNMTREREAISLLDASQSLGQVPFSRDLPTADIVVSPGHKWLLGMHGTAVLYVRQGICFEPLIQGGTGLKSDSLDMPVETRDLIEVGTLDLPAVAALGAGCNWLHEKGVESVALACRELAQACYDGLRDIQGVRLITTDPSEGSIGPPIISMVCDGYSPPEVAVMLEQIAGVQVRSGYHCAACIHEFLGTTQGGTVRVSFGPFSGISDVDAVVSAMKKIML